MTRTYFDPKFVKTMTAPDTLLAPVATSNRQVSLRVGIPCERGFQENRVAITPQGVALLVHNGHQVVVERDAGFLVFLAIRITPMPGLNWPMDRPRSMPVPWWSK